jgi:hypothetical protein
VVTDIGLRRERMGPAPHLDKRYELLCAAIKSTDEISFRLLGIVPFITGGAIVGLLLKGEVNTRWLVIVSIFGAIVTFGLYVWERRNMSHCEWLRDQAAKLEENEFHLASGQFLGGPKVEHLFGLNVRKRSAEAIVYGSAILAWLALALSTLR